jgi:hypothetical protein
MHALFFVTKNAAVLCGYNMMKKMKCTPHSEARARRRCRQLFSPQLAQPRPLALTKFVFAAFHCAVFCCCLLYCSLHCFLRWLLALFSALGAELCVWGHIFVLYFYVVPRF